MRVRLTPYGMFSDYGGAIPTTGLAAALAAQGAAPRTGAASTAVSAVPAPRTGAAMLATMGATAANQNTYQSVGMQAIATPQTQGVQDMVPRQAQAGFHISPMMWAGGAVAVGGLLLLLLKRR